MGLLPSEKVDAEADLSYTDAAASLGVSERTVRRLVDDGDLVAIRIRGRCRIPVWALRDYRGRIEQLGLVQAQRRRHGR